MKDVLAKSSAAKRSVGDLMDSIGYPCTIKIFKGKRRSDNQNRTQHMWIREAVDQLQDQTTEELRSYLKLHIGVPILRNEDDDFRDAYDRIIKPLDYQMKLEMMRVPLDWPVTRLMTTNQGKDFLDQVYYHLTTERGCHLTEPNEPPMEVYG
jgi:hypothetical protein